MGEDEPQTAPAIGTGVEPQTPLQGDEGEAMDIHRPKAAHSWREFAIEIGTIICGILIALGLEQMVEAIQRDAEIREAREALHQEIAENLAILVYAKEEDRCARGQYDAYVAWAKDGPKPPPLRANLIGFYTSTWETVKARAVPSMPLRERRALAAFYDILANTQPSVTALRSNVGTLRGLTAHDRLNEADAARVLETATASRWLTSLHASILSRALQLGAETGGATPHPTPLQRNMLDWACNGGRPNPLTGEP